MPKTKRKTTKRTTRGKSSKVSKATQARKRSAAAKRLRRDGGITVML